MLARLLRQIVGDAVFQMAVALLVVWGSVQLVERFGPSIGMLAEQDESELLNSPPLARVKPAVSAAQPDSGPDQLVSALPDGVDGL